MSKCRIEKRVWKDPDQSSDYTCLFYELEVEATPERGRELHDGRWYSGPLTFVVWNVDEGRFKCRVEDDLPCHDGVYDYTHEFLVGNALHQGWRLCEVPGGDRDGRRGAVAG